MSSDTSELPYPIPAQHSIFVLDLACIKSGTLIQKVGTSTPVLYNFNKLFKANNGRFFASPFKWLIYLKNENFEYNLNATFAKVDILVDSDVNLAMFSDNNTAILQKIYKRRRALPIIFENFANWTQEEGIEEAENFERVTARRRRNLDGLILNTCIVITNKDTLNHLTDKR